MDERTPDEPRASTGTPAAPRAGRGRVPRLAGLAIAGIAVGAALLACGPGPTTPDPVSVAPSDSAGPADTAAPADLRIGDTAPLADGAVARLNGVETGVTLDPGLPAPEPGIRLDRLDVEVCAGSDELFADAAFWNGLGSDRRVHSAHMGVRSFFTLALAPGSCQRGFVELAVPDDVELEAVLLIDTDLATVAQWSADGEADAAGPLASTVDPDVVAIGTPVELDVGGTATVHAATTGGNRVRAEAELCAGADPLPTNPRHWYLDLADQRLVVAIAESPMRDDVLEAGECDRGFLDFVVPGHASPAGVRYAYGGQFEEARWEIAQ